MNYFTIYYIFKTHRTNISNNRGLFTSLCRFLLLNLPKIWYTFC